MAARGLQMFNREIERELGVANVITMAREATLQNAEQIFQHPDVALLCVTGCVDAGSQANGSQPSQRGLAATGYPQNGHSCLRTRRAGMCLAR